MGTTLQQPAANQDSSSLRTDDISTETTSAGELNLPVPKKPRLFANYTRTKVQTTSVKSVRILVQQYIEYLSMLKNFRWVVVRGALACGQKSRTMQNSTSWMCCLKKYSARQQRLHPSSGFVIQVACLWGHTVLEWAINCSVNLFLSNATVHNLNLHLWTLFKCLSDVQ